MLKINKKYNEKFIREYTSFTLNEVVKPRLAKLTTKIPAAEKTNFLRYFSDFYLENIIIAKAGMFEGIIKNLFENFPLLAERYFFGYILSSIDLKLNYKDMDLSTKKSRSEFDSHVHYVINKLTMICSRKNLILAKKYLNDLNKPTARSKKKKILCRLENALRGRSVITDKIKNLFPAWVNDFEECFDYESVAKKFGLDITSWLDLTICPYCGFENIQTYREINLRPDLDHFYPKTRFPFLAVSLYNLIPSGAICNQKHKKNHPMLGYMHPLIDSLDRNTVFSFGMISGFAAQPVKFKIIEQNCDEKSKNIEIFRLTSLYNGNEELRKWFLNTLSIRDTLLEGGMNFDLVDFDNPLYKQTLDLDLPATKTSAQKFKVDIVNSLFGKNLTTKIQQE